MKKLLLSVSLICFLAACKTTKLDTMATGSINQPVLTEQQWRARIQNLAPAYANNMKDKETAFNYAVALRQTGQSQQAVAILQRLTLEHPNDLVILGEFGRALSDNKNYSQALDVLARSHTPEQPDWRIFNAIGSVHDQTGNSAEAQNNYNRALKIAPSEPRILSNLGLSYALAGNAKQGEDILRQAASVSTDMRIKQNLALVVGLQGRMAEAEALVTLPQNPQESAQNIQNLKNLLASLGTKRS